MSPFWLAGWSIALSVSWLLPNHYLPWSTFHMDAWLSMVLLLASAVVIWRSTGPVVWHSMAVIAAALAFVPGLQYAFGLIMFSGTAWVATAYLMGFWLALLTGSRWELASPGQLADGLFLAIGVAALVSVGLQFHQWLGLDLLDIWSMGGGLSRPYANFGQPNQLATFLLWGVLAAAWGLVRQRIGAGTALLMAVYLLFGLALTASRTAWMAVGILVFASWAWRDLWPDQRWPWVLTALALYFAMCVMAIDWLNQLLLLTLPAEAGDILRISGELRPAVWSLFIDAILQQPFSGYGWNQGGLAALSVATDYPTFHVFFFHAHNVFLDLMLWCGIPVGLFVSIYLLRWLWLRLRAVSRAEDAVLLLFVLVVGNHAMLELPLQYAYFLLPLGLVMGALNVRLGARCLLVAGRWSVIAVWLASTLLLALLIRDYARVEPSYLSLRFEWARIKTETRGGPPEVLLLTQWRELIRFARLEPANDMSADDLVWMRKVASTIPSGGSLLKLASALAMNRQTEEAQMWLKKLCKFVSVSQCAAAKTAWANQSLANPLIAAVPWPEG